MDGPAMLEERFAISRGLPALGGQRANARRDELEGLIQQVQPGPRW